MLDSAPMTRRAAPWLALAALIAAAVIAAGCGKSGAPATAASSAHGATLRVVAAENFWGSIAGQLGGEHASVHSIIVNPSADPHTYQPSAADARALATAGVAIVNGLGYDNWSSQLLSASPASGRVVLDVGQLLGLHEGANQHRWYYPADVRAVIAAITADYSRQDPADAAYFAARKQAFETQTLARYDQLRGEIRARYAGVPVGYSESIFEGLGEDLGLKLLTPYSFVKAIAEGTDVTAQDKQTVDAQAQQRQIKVWVFNSQNVTPDVKRVNEIATRGQIPIATVTETLSPASSSFQAWQLQQLEGLARALHTATGR
jgi:zinc/manganese transport system substrate-binding protein